MKYIKLHFTFKERILAFFGLINDKYLETPIKSVSIESQTNTTVPTTKEHTEDKPSKVEIPFFDLNNDDIKSNL